MFIDIFSGLIRQIRRSPFTTVINLISLSVGLACIVAVWAVTAYWTHSDNHFENADRIEIVTQKFGNTSSGTGPRPLTSRFLSKYLRLDHPHLEAIALLSQSWTWTLVAGDRKANLRGVSADPEFVEIFDFDFIYGQPSNALTAPNSVVLTKSGSERLFGDTNPVGQPIILDESTEYTVTGVIDTIPQPSHFGSHPDAITKFDFFKTWPLQEQEGEEWWLYVEGTTYVLLPKTDVASQRAKLRSDLESYAEKRIPSHQRDIVSVKFSSIALKTLFTRDLDIELFQNRAGVLSVTTILFGLGVLILFVSCLNYANLAAAQATNQTKEIGMRKVFGAERRSVFVQYWAGALILTIVASIFAFLVVFLFSPSVEARTGIDMSAAYTPNLTIGIVFLGLVLLVSFASSAYPSYLLAATRPAEALRSGRSKSGSRRLNEILVGAQFFAASLLLILVIVVNQQNSHLRTISSSKGDGNVVALLDRASRDLGADGIEEAVISDPAIHAVSHMNFVPWGRYDAKVTFARTRKEDGIEATAFYSGIGFGFFKVFDTQLLAGRVYDREIDASEMDPDAVRTESVVVIDRWYATQLGFESPAAAVGEYIYYSRKLASGSDDDPSFKIIGVVETIPLVFGTDGVSGNVYMLQGDGATVPVIRFDAKKTAEAIKTIETAVASRRPNALPILAFVDTRFEQNFRKYEGIEVSFSGLSIVAFTIAAMGLFAMAVHVARKRRHEIGIRKTLGASTGEIVGLLVKDFSKPVLIANLLAWPLAYLAAKAYLDSFMQKIELGPGPWIAGGTITIAIACIAVGGQAWLAAKADPAEVLRDE